MEDKEQGGRRDQAYGTAPAPNRQDRYHFHVALPIAARHGNSK